MDSYHLAPNVEVHPSNIGGETVYVYANDISGEHFAVDRGVHVTLEALLAGIPASRLKSEQPKSFAKFAKVLPLLLQSGLLRGPGGQRMGPASAPKQKPLDQKLLFGRLELFKINAQFDCLLPVVNWLFSRTGALCYVALIVSCLLLGISNLDVITENIERASTNSTVFFVSITIAFLLTKLIHELGHALTTRSLFFNSGKNPPAIWAGVATFFFFPFPFTNTTASWRLESKWSRVKIAAAGMYVESWIALICLALLTSIGEGELQFFLFQIVLVSGISTLLFNLNPLIRLDGYYILTDTCNIPNLATRAGEEVRAFLTQILFSKSSTCKIDRSLVSYGVAAYIYRISMFTAVFIVAFFMDEFLGYAVLAAGLTILVIRPSLALFKIYQQSKDDINIGGSVMRVVSVACVLLAVCLVPLPNYKTFDGHLQFLDHRYVYLEGSGRLSLADGKNISEDNRIVAQLDNPELAFQRKAAEAKLNLAEVVYRKTLSEGAERQDEARQGVRSARAELDELQRQTEQQTISGTVDAIWHPNAQRSFDGTWHSPSDREQLGILLPKKGFEAVIQIPEHEVMFDIAELKKQFFDVRISGTWQGSIKTAVAIVTRTASRSSPNNAGSNEDQAAMPEQPSSFEVRLNVPEHGLPEAVKLHGKQVTARLFNGYHSLGSRLSTWLKQMRQKRIDLRQQ